MPADSGGIRTATTGLVSRAAAWLYRASVATIAEVEEDRRSWRAGEGQIASALAGRVR